MRNKGMKNITSVLLAAAMAVSGLFSAGNVVNLHAEEVNPYGLHTPIERDTDGDGTKEMTWDCIIFGVYPQNEITADTKLGKSKLNALKKLSESQWIPLDNPAKSDETISYYVGGTGKKYLRMTKKDATYSLSWLGRSSQKRVAPPSITVITPVAMGSSVPVWPHFFSLQIRRTLATAPKEVMFFGLSKIIIPVM